MSWIINNENWRNLFAKMAAGEKLFRESHEKPEKASKKNFVRSLGFLRERNKFIVKREKV